MTDTMKAVQFKEYGPPTTLVVEETDRPEPGEGKLLVKVHATGVHPYDTKLRRGVYKDFMPLALPHRPGVDFAGTVVSTGPGVTGFRPGDAVFGSASGAYAEYALAPADAVALKPEVLSFEEAAAVPLGACTAWSMLDAADPKPGQKLLIHGGAGGVGTFAVQLARWRGADVIATTSTDNVEFVKSLGATTVIDYTATDFETVAASVDAVLDTVGGDVIDRSWSVLRKGGILVTIAGQPSEDVAKEHGVRALSVMGKTTAERLVRIAELIEDGTLVVSVSTVFPLEKARDAHELSETGHGRGRIVLKVSG